MHNEWTLRTQMLLGAEALERLGRAHVAVFGLGGVGSFAAEALARSGIGALTLVDHDTVSVTNLNRQLLALRSSVGSPKAEVAARRIADINPDCRVRALPALYRADDRELFFGVRYDYIIDAIDMVSAKLDLIQTALSRAVPIVSALGTGNKTNASALRIGDISETRVCPLAKVVRKELKARGIYSHRVLWSDEKPATPSPGEAPAPGKRSVPASICWVPGTAGLMLAGEVVLSLARAALPEGEGRL